MIRVWGGNEDNNSYLKRRVRPKSPSTRWIIIIIIIIINFLFKKCVDAAVFDLEYTRWLEEHHRLTCELRAAVQEHIPENELKIYVDNCLAHYDIVMNLKGMVAKSDVFHLVSGMWKTPAERCFMWMGGFRPSELIKVHRLLLFFVFSFYFFNLKSKLEGKKMVFTFSCHFSKLSR